MTTYVRETTASASTVSSTTGATGIRTNAAAGTTSGDATVTDTGITTADFGSPCSGTNIGPNPAFVGTVSTGASFELSSVQGGMTPYPATGTATITLTVVTAKILLAANPLRKMATVYNESTAVMYLKLGKWATTTSYTVQVPAGGFYELPHPVYHGVISAVWAAANGSARVTEVS
jgi:hypothetical protein